MGGTLSVQSSGGGRALGQPDLCPEGSGGKRAAAQATTKASGVFLHEIDSPVPQLKQVNCFSTTEELFAALRKGYVDAIAGHEAKSTAFVKGGKR